MFTLDRVVPWGRSFDEYCRMFALSSGDLRKRLLGCGDGPASFNAEATRHGHHVVSCDPLYRFDVAQIEERITATYDRVLDQARQNAHEFVWGGDFRDVTELGAARMAAMRNFLDDYESGQQAGRYVNAALPSLPFGNATFDLALCSHVLFLYSTQFGEEFHHVAVTELCRVAAEVRVFPLLALGGARSPFVDSCASRLEAAGFEAATERVPYEFQRGGNEMLRIRRRGPL